jgi:hypothetical protein
VSELKLKEMHVAKRVEHIWKKHGVEWKANNNGLWRRSADPALREVPFTLEQHPSPVILELLRLKRALDEAQARVREERPAFEDWYADTKDFGGTREE